MRLPAMRRTWRVLRLLALLAVADGGAPAWAIGPDEVLPDKALEARARALSAELRCLVCQNQSIDDSDAPLARDLRVVVRDRLKAGDSDRDVRAYVVSRYGDFVLLRPPLRPYTVLLWLGPALVVGMGATGLLLARRRRAAVAPPPLSAEEAQRLEAVLQTDRA